MAYKWTGPLAHYAPRVTGDRRRLEAGGIDHRSLPLPLRYGNEGGHDKAVDVGALTSIDLSGPTINASGFFLPQHIEPQVVPAMYKLAAGINGPSLDMEPGSLDYGMEHDEAGEPFMSIKKGTMMAATIVSKPAFADVRLNISAVADSELPMPFSLVAAAATAVGWQIEVIDDDWAMEQFGLIHLSAWEAEVEQFTVRSDWGGVPIATGNPSWDAGAATAAVKQWAGDNMGKYAKAFLYKDASGDPKLQGSYKFPIATISNGHLTIIPNAVRAAASRVSSADIPGPDKDAIQRVTHALLMRIGGGSTEIQVGLVAGGGPLAPSIHAFDNPNLDKPTPVTITPDGRIFGHIALWNVCHTGIANACILAPHSKLNYAKFHQGTVLTSEGEEIRAGKITLGGGHAHARLGLIPATEHYDNTCTQVAVVCAGEDPLGIWFAGSLLPGLSAERIAELRRSPLSGDWRPDQSVNNLELIAALAVNSPGFPVFEMGEDGISQLSLVAAGMVVMEVEDSGQEGRAGHLAALVAEDEMKAQQARAAQLAEILGGEK